MSATFRALEIRNYRALGGRCARLQHRHLDAAGRPGLAGAHRTHRPLGHRRRHHHRPAVPADPLAWPLRRACSPTGTATRILLVARRRPWACCALALGLLVLTGTAAAVARLRSSPCASASPAPRRAGPPGLRLRAGRPRRAAQRRRPQQRLVQLGRLIGPAVAGLLIAWFGTGPVFLLNAASFAAVLISLFRMRTARAGPVPRRPRGRHQSREGLRYVRAARTWC